MNKSNDLNKNYESNSKNDNSPNSSIKNADLTHKLKVMTYEETFNSWMGVGLGALVGGLYMARIVYLKDESTITYFIGLGGSLTSIILFTLSFILFKKNMDHVKNKHAQKSPFMALTGVISLLLIIGAILSFILIISN